MFIDEAKICVVGGRGGHGRVAFRPVGKSPHKRRPNGGSGGWGGDVILRANPRMRTLLTFTKKIHWKADCGANGGPNSKTGKSAKHLVVPVPLGTVVKALRTQRVLADLSQPGARVRVVQGGVGGRGNEAFLSNRYKSPRISELGERGEELWLSLELKVLADVGLIGFPNAGKSTLIGCMSSAKPKVGSYPFTTLEPQLGVVQAGPQEFVAVDIPGLIEGAHLGKGLGDKFLKHIERTRVLVHLVDLASLEERDPLDDYDKINRELRAFSPELAKKPQLVVGNKIDLLDADAVSQYVARFAARGVDLQPLSAATGRGVETLVRHCTSHIEVLDDATQDDDEHRVYTLEEPPSPWTLEREAAGFRLRGPQVKRLGLLRLNTDDALVYLHDQLERLGVFDALTAHGARPGDTVRIGDNAFEFSDAPIPRL